MKAVRVVVLLLVLQIDCICFIRDATEDAPCAEFCARNLYRKLLARLSEVTGEWGAAEIAEALQKSCEDVDVDFLARPGCTCHVTVNGEAKRLQPTRQRPVDEDCKA